MRFATLFVRKTTAKSDEPNYDCCFCPMHCMESLGNQKLRKPRIDNTPENVRYIFNDMLNPDKSGMHGDYKDEMRDIVEELAENVKHWAKRLSEETYMLKPKLETGEKNVE